MRRRSTNHESIYAKGSSDTPKQIEQRKLLDEMEQVTGLHRKYLIALMGGDLKRKPRR
jgi:hypothetical protein